MLKNKYNTILLTVILIIGVKELFAQNPIVQTNYTADPAPLVYNGTLYLYTSHDEDNSTWFVMNDWKLYTTQDMVNWTDHGTIAGYKTFDWAIGDAWAMQVVERNDKFYLYAPVKARKTGRSAIGVAVADSPYGPFYDPLGKPLVSVSHGDIDPTVFIDDDGQAYLYWGNPDCYYARLKDDMIALKGRPVKVPMTVSSFGKREGSERRPTLYEEGPWLYKRNDLYYLLWAGGPIPEHIGYSTSKNPLGPWRYRGTLMLQEGRSFTNHPGIIDYKGKTYFFYHNGALPGGGGFTRSVCVQEAAFNKDGSLQQMKMDKAGVVESLQPLDPFQKTEAETIAWSENVKATQNKEVGVFINAMANGAYSMVKDVDFKEGATKFIARVGTTHNKGVSMEVHLDRKDGPLITNLKVPFTGGDNRWRTVSSVIDKVTGIHDVFFVFKGDKPGRIMYFDYWMVSK